MNTRYGIHDSPSVLVNQLQILMNILDFKWVNWIRISILQHVIT